MNNQIVTNTKLFNAIREEKSLEHKLRKIEKHLNEGARIDAVDKNDKDNTPLHLAVREGKEEIVEFLLERGAKIDVRNNDDEIPLDIAKSLPESLNKQNIIKLINQEQNSWQIDVPHDGNCLFWAVALAYLTPEKDNNDLFQERFKRLFGHKKLGDLQSVKSSIQNYNRFLSWEEISNDRTLSELTTKQFRSRVVKHMRSKEAEFKPFAEGESGHTFDEYLYNMDTPGEWGGEPEIKAMSQIFRRTIQVYGSFTYKNGNDHVKLYHVNLVGDVNRPNTRNHYNFSLEKSIDDAYQSMSFNQEVSKNQQQQSKKRKNLDEESELEQNRKKVKESSSDSSEGSTGKIKPVDIPPLDIFPVKRPKPDSCSELESYKTSGGLKLNIHGVIYQLKLLMLFLHRGIENRYSFKLATERDGIGAFDDVFFEYDQNKLCCLQAKHKLNKREKITYSDLFPPSKKDKTDGEFAIQKYFISYLEAKLNFKKEAKELEYLIICTNINFDFKEEGKLKQPQGEKYLLFDKIETQKDEYKLLNKLMSVYNSKKEPGFYKFTARTEEKKKIILDILTLKPEVMAKERESKFNRLLQDLQSAQVDIEVEKSNFLNILVLAVNQPDEKELGNCIKKEVGERYKLTDSDLLYDNFLATMLDWFKEKEGTYHTDERGKSFFNEAEQRLAKLILIGLTLEYRTKIKEFNIKFERRTIQEIQLCSFLTYKRQIFSLITHHNMLSAIKIYQAFKIIPKYKNEDSYIFIRLSSLLRIQNCAIQAFKSKTSNNLLIIESKEDKSIKKKKIEKLYNQLSGIINSNTNKKIILVTKQDDALANLFRTKLFDRYEEKKDEKNSFIDLTHKSQKKLLEKGTVKFQGQEISLGKLVDQNSRKIINAEVLSQLINNEEIEIGNVLSNLGEIEDYYINRTFNRQIKIEKSFENNKSKFFTIKDINEHFSELTPEQDIILIDNGSTDNKFKQLCKTKSSKHNIHWLKRENGEFIWKQSKGVLSNLREFVKKYVNTYNPEKITDITDKIVIIASESGMGKSTVLTYLAKQTKEFDSSLWVIRVNLNDHTEDLSKEIFGDNKLDKDNIDKALNFVLTITNFKTPLEKKLFKHNFQYQDENQGKIALLFDGFDEISPTHKEKVIKLLQILKNTKVEKLWVTTRPHIQSELEDKLSIFSYTLEPFSRKNQERFLKKFWSKSLSHSDINEKHLEAYTEKILNFVSNSICDKEREFTGIPLQTRMLAEVFEESFEKFYNSNQDEPKLPRNLDLLDLYQHFINKKYDILYNEKMNVVTGNQAGEDALQSLKKDVEKQHQYLALNMLFPEQTNSWFQNKRNEKREREEDEKLTRVGIIDRITLDGKPRFVHRTFAEYFAANLLVSILKKPENDPKHRLVCNFLREQIFKEENEVIRNFFDRMLTKDEHNKNKYEIHISALNDDKNTINNLLSDAPNIINSRDKAGRAALHLAAAYGHLDIVQVLLEHGANVNIADDIFSWKSLSYAAKTSKWNIAELLLQKGANSDDMFEVINNINSADEIKQALLHIAAQEGYMEFARALVEKGADVNARDKNYYGRTPLHLAARYGHLYVVKFLIKEGADFIIADNDGGTPLHEAAFYGNLDVVKYFIKEKEADFKAIDDFGRTPLYRAAENGCLEVVKLLVGKGADIDINSSIVAPTRGASAWTALHSAVHSGHLDVIKFLVERGAKTDVKDSVGRTPLSIAVSNGYLEIAEFLKSDDTHLLHAAVAGGKLELVKSLVEKGIDVNSKLDWTPLHLAAFRGRLDVVKFLISKGANINHPGDDGWTPLHSASSNGYLDVVKFLIEKEANINAANNDGFTSLHAAARNGHLDIIKYFIEDLGKNVDVNVADEKGTTPLHTAAFHDRFDVVEFLLNKGADINAIDKCGATTVFYAALNNSRKITKFLLSKNAIIVADKKKLLGMLQIKILHAAAAYDALEIVKILVEEKGVDVNDGEKTSLTPLHFAAAFDSSEVIKYLVKHGANVNALISVSNITSIIHRMEDTLKASSMHRVIMKLLGFVDFFRINSIFDYFVRLTPNIISEGFGHDNPLLRHELKKKFITDPIVKWVISLSYVNKQVSILKSYIDQRKVGDSQPLVDSECMFYLVDDPQPH